MENVFYKKSVLIIVITNFILGCIIFHVFNRVSFGISEYVAWVLTIGFILCLIILNVIIYVKCRNKYDASLSKIGYFVFLFIVPTFSPIALNRIALVLIDVLGSID